MKIKFIVLYLILGIMYVFENSKVFSVNIADDLIIHNMDIGKNIIVCEYETYVSGNKVNYVGLYFKEEKILKQIRSNDGNIINSDMFFPSISDDDRYVVFTSDATNITNDRIGRCYDVVNYLYSTCSNIYIYDVQKETSFLIKNGDEQLNGSSYIAKISGDGRSVVFESSATNNLNYGNIENCEIDGNNICINIFKYNITTKAISLISTKSDNHGGDYNSISPSISDDGRYIVFQSIASNLVNIDNGNCKNDYNEKVGICSNIYLYDTKETILKLVTINEKNVFNDNSGNAIISGNGSYIMYESYATNIESKHNNKQNIVIYDVESKKNSIISKSEGVLNNGDSYLIDLSDDGKYAAYISNSCGVDAYGENGMYIYNIDNTKVSLFGCGSSYETSRIDDRKLCFYEGSAIKCEKLDMVPPIIKKNQEIYILKDCLELLKSKIIVSDNLSSQEEMELYMSNNLLLNNVGVYNVEVTVTDEFENVCKEFVKIYVVENDEEGPVFTDIEKIKILKGSSTLNLNNYIEAIDKIEGNTRIYIIDDGNLNLNSTGKYKITLMSKDSSQNVSYKNIYIIVYENYDFAYYYEIILILGLLAVIIFSIIKVK